jgi:hypothetical protein
MGWGNRWGLVAGSPEPIGPGRGGRTAAVGTVAARAGIQGTRMDASAEGTDSFPRRERSTAVTT